MKMIKTLFRLLRVNNWIKNVLIIFPSFFGKKKITFQVAEDLLLAILLFSLLSSCVYIINDLADLSADRNHPTKKRRPIAAGEVRVPTAIIICLLLLGGTFFLTLQVLSNQIAMLWLLFYLFFNLLYTFLLKHLLIIEFYSIAIFFEIRLFYGGSITDITISPWLALTVFFLATLIAIGKRRDDVLLQANSEQNIRTNTKHYNIIFLDALITINSSLLVFIYIVYSVSDWVVNNYSKYFYLSDIFVILGLSKYLYTVFVNKKSGDPVKLLLEDKFLLVCLTLWFLSVYKFIYYDNGLF
ncbi:hypothetical protein FAM09_10800 [Niastella caeni]|uniref:Prenyltransferase n=1 Tax=Niastella caeni TaxID=2569763 RepID=A0A4S8HX83_9BACT|nr:UbiA prenyltransferase family protein [Niastella caeni]THU40348.1 hypothetical protein FAM09_10800 [Niastella caeni]